jgi:hypothetical protein
MIKRLPRPAAHKREVFDGAFWVDEQIWGHRLYDEQTPWLTVLEFLSVFLSQPALTGRADLKYTPQRQLRLRNIVFNNPYFAEVIREPPLTDSEAWSSWAELMDRGAALSDESFIGLRDSIPRFPDFVRVVEYLRRTSIEGNSNKRWSSKFVFPFGPSALYEDLRVKESSASNDRRFFARSGELLYLMLGRSARASELAALIKERFLGVGDPTHRIVHALQGIAEPASDSRPIGYLPYEALPDFDELTDDWLFLLRQPLPRFDFLPHLVSVTGLHLLKYFLGRARDQLGHGSGPVFVCEIVSPRRNSVREVAVQCFEQNQALPREAVERLIREVDQSTEWKKACADPEAIQACARVLEARFDWPDDSELESINAHKPEDLINQLVQRALLRHRQHFGKIHGTWARHIGLSSRRGSQRVRYAPTDALIKALVFANVQTRMEFKLFLKRLHERYGIVIGEHQSGAYLSEGAADLEDFAENATRLEERLTSMGLMKRLSDACAYVQLPFSAREANG